MDSKQYYFNSITDDAERQRLQKVFAEEIRSKDVEALNHLLSDKKGRWFLVRLLESTCYQGQSFTGNSATFYNEGRRAVGIELNQRIAALGLQGVEHKHLAEIEYIKYQGNIIDILADKKLKSEVDKREE